MTEATTGAARTKPATHTASPFDLPKYETPKFDLPQIEVPQALREMAEKGISQIKGSYDKAKAAAEDANDLAESTYTAAAKGVTNYNLKVIEIARANTNAAFDYFREALGVKSLSEFVELSTAQTRKQFETMTEQTKQLTALAQKTATETAEPLKTGLTKAFTKLTSS